MKNKMKDYFDDFSNAKLRDTYSKKSLITKQKSFAYAVKKVKVAGSDKDYLLKETSSPIAVATVASANMYNNIDIATPTITPLRPTKKGIIQTIQPDITQLPGVDILLANDDREYMRITQSIMGRDKWEIFYNYDFQSRLLQIMTPECLEQLQNMFLVDELRTDIDRHALNFFLWRKKGSKLYEGIIVIDLEQMEVMTKCGTSKADFENFLYTPYYSVTPQHKKDYLCYIEKVHHIRNLIQEGVLTQNNIDTMVSALKYDLARDIKKINHKLGIYGGNDYNQSVVPIQRLQDYNRKTIGKDLGL